MAFTAKDADPGLLPTLAAIAIGLAGGAHALLAVQFLIAGFLGTFEWLVVMAMLFGGAAAVFLASRLAQGRTWAAVVGTGLSPFLGLLSVGYSAWSLWNTTFAVYMLFAPPLAFLATVLVPFAILPCRRAAKAAAELRQRYTSGPFSHVLDA